MLEVITRKQSIRPSALIVSALFVIIGILGATNGWIFAYLWLPIMGTLALVTQFGVKGTTQLFPKFEARHWKATIVILMITYIVSIATSLIGKAFKFGNQSANPAAGPLEDGGFAAFKLLATTWVSLIGEELVTAAIAFPIFIYAKKRFSIKSSIFIALMISSIAFGLMHLNAYDWNWYQCLVVIGLTRIPLTLLWFKTNTLWSGIICHIIYDYIIFIFVFLVGLL